MQTAERYSCVKPANSRWDNGWLISMTSIGGFEMVQYPSDRPFVLSRAEWHALPEDGPERRMPAVLDTAIKSVAWDMSRAYRMVRQRDHALTDRQRGLQSEQHALAKQLGQLRTRIEALGASIAVVEKAGGDAQNLRTQIGVAHTETRRIAPRHAYLEQATSLLAANLRLIRQAHDALHWLNFENSKLAAFDQQPEVPKPAKDQPIATIA